MDKFDLQKLRDLPIEEVASQLGLTVHKHKALCPFHADTNPSLSFSVRHNSYKCFVCGAHGGVIDLVMKVTGKNFLESCEWLGADVRKRDAWTSPCHGSEAKNVTGTCPRGTAVDREWLESLVAHPTLCPEAEQFLFQERKLDSRVIKWLGISSITKPTPCWRYGRPYFDAPSLLIPYRDMNGRLLTVQSRYLEPRNRVTARFKFPRSSRCGIYNLPILRLLKKDEPLFITEGVTDCLAMLSAGHKAIAIPSATLLSREDRQLLKQYVEQHGPLHLHMYPDADIPGEKLYLELVSLANELQCSLTRHSLPPGYKDFGAYWAHHQTLKNQNV